MKTTCKEAEDLIRPYLAHELRYKEKKILLTHAAVCERCYDELETNAILESALDYLQNDKDKKLDLEDAFKRQFKKDLADIKRLGFIRKILTVVLSISAALCLIVLIHHFFYKWWPGSLNDLYITVKKMIMELFR